MVKKNTHFSERMRLYPEKCAKITPELLWKFLSREGKKHRSDFSTGFWENSYAGYEGSSGDGRRGDYSYTGYSSSTVVYAERRVLGVFSVKDFPYGDLEEKYSAPWSTSEYMERIALSIFEEALGSAAIVEMRQILALEEKLKGEAFPEMKQALEQAKKEKRISASKRKKLFLKTPAPGKLSLEELKEAWEAFQARIEEIRNA